MEHIQSIKKLERLLHDIEKIKDNYDKLRKEDRFNIFYALHKEHDEVNLHSRFISYLLTKNSGHGKGDFFAREFFKIVFEDKVNEKFLDDYEVVPNEFNKTEFEEIDILLVNKKLSHAIIIENKIYAKDSNHQKPEEYPKGYEGQLERYYSTIKRGKPKRTYKGNYEIETTDYHSTKIDIFYLTLNPPKEDSFTVSKGYLENVEILYYNDKIIKWLESSIEKIEENNYLKTTINQYLILVKNMTKTNIPEIEINDLRNVYSKNWETTQYIIENFNHIKWHTIADFFDLLVEKIGEEKCEDVSLYPKDKNERGKLITDLAFYNKDVNMGVLIKKNKDETFYISSLNNLSWGILQSEKWEKFKDSELENIRFSDFSTENTYKLINIENRENAVSTIIKEILK